MRLVTFECIAVLLLPGKLFVYILMLFSMEGYRAEHLQLIMALTDRLNLCDCSTYWGTIADCKVETPHNAAKFPLDQLK